MLAQCTNGSNVVVFGRSHSAGMLGEAGVEIGLTEREATGLVSETSWRACG